MYSEIASNKRRSTVIIGVFFVIWVAVGAVLGLLFRAFYHPSVTPGLAPAQPTGSGWTPVLVGLVIGGLVLGDQVPRRIQRSAGGRGAGRRSRADSDADRNSRAARQHPAGRRMLDSGFAALDRRDCG